MIPILLATSKASKSPVNRTYAFLTPSGLIKVLTCIDRRGLGTELVSVEQVSERGPPASRPGEFELQLATHLGGLDIIQRLNSQLDLLLAGLWVAQEYKGVVVLDLLHCAADRRGR